MLAEAKAIKEIVKANAAAVYKDAAQPSIRVLGKSLAQCISLFASPVGRMAEIFEKNIHLYLNKLDGLSEDEIVPPDTRILVPILEKLRFTDEEKVAEYYAEILATASKKEHSKKVMITFIEILNRLTADEIKILEHINSLRNIVSIPNLTEEEYKKYNLPVETKNVLLTGGFPVIGVNIHSEKEIGYHSLIKNFNYLSEKINFDTPENIESYIDNMISLGLLEKKYSYQYAIDKVYYHLENHPQIIKMKKEVKEGQRIELARGRIDLTSLGEKLLTLCCSKNK